RWWRPACSWRWAWWPSSWFATRSEVPREDGARGVREWAALRGGPRARGHDAPREHPRLPRRHRPLGSEPGAGDGLGAGGARGDARARAQAAAARVELRGAAAGARRWPAGGGRGDLRRGLGPRRLLPGAEHRGAGRGLLVCAALRLG